MWMTAYRKLRVEAKEHFEGVREVVIHVAGHPETNRQALAAAQVRCQKGGPETSALDCLTCPHIINFRPGPRAEQVTLRCLYCETDPVSGIMTLPRELCAVDPATPVRLADEIARQHGIRHLLVARNERVVGVVCRCDLVPPVADDDLIAGRMEPLPCAVTVGATLGEAAAAMRSHGIAMLLVVNGHELVGVVTRGDLRRAGVPEELLGAHTCMACGSSHGVCCPPGNPGAEFCLDCIDKAGEPSEAEESRGGD